MLGDYLQFKFQLIDIVYNYCYRKNRYICDWIGFLDLDEFLYIENNLTLKQYFYKENFNKCQLIFFNWIMFNDNNLIRYDKRKLLQRFTFPSFNFSEGKSFIRGGIENFIISSTHIPGINIFHFCNSNGELIYPNDFYQYKFEKHPKAYIKHFYTKTVEEFCDKYCKYPDICLAERKDPDAAEDLLYEKYCGGCPMNRI